MTEHFTYTFKSDLTLGEIRKRLDEAGPWKWHEADNDRWGDYLTSIPLAQEAENAYVKILIDPDALEQYVVQVRFTSTKPDAKVRLDELRSTVSSRLLPSIGARELATADTYE